MDKNIYNIDQAAIEVVKKYDGSLSDDEIRQTIGYIIIKKALLNAYMQGHNGATPILTWN